MRTRDENQRLRDDGNLEVDDGVQLGVVLIVRSSDRAVREGDAELAVEEVGADANSDERDAI